MSKPLQTARSRLHPLPRGRHIFLTPRDQKLFKLLDRYRYLPSNFLLAFVGGNRGYHKARMTDLFHEGWLSKPLPQWEVLNARYRFDTYELGRKAIRALDDQGTREARRLGTGGAFRHELLVCLIMASLELSAQRHGVELLGWKDVLLGAPESTRHSEAPFAIPMLFSHDGRTVSRTLRPDASPFALRGSQKTFHFVGIEVDRHTEPLHPTDLMSRHSSILMKLLQYRHLVRERLFERHYGMSNVFVPIITVNEAHMRKMMDLALRITDGQGFKWMLFRTMADLASLERSSTPDFGLLAAPWQRAGNPPLSLLQELNRD
jgi:hypothetical protein